MAADPATLERIALAFAWVIDAKSPYTYEHSEGVSAIAARIGAGPRPSNCALQRGSYRGLCAAISITRAV